MVPRSISRDSADKALKELLRTGWESKNDSTKFDVLFQGNRLPPKKVVSVEARIGAGNALDVSGFSGGDETNDFIKSIGYEIVPKAASPTTQKLDVERLWRMAIFEKVSGSKDTPVKTQYVRELGIYGGAQGIWVDKKRTAPLSQNGNGIAVGVLHTGSSYADNMSDEYYSLSLSKDSETRQ